jgi:GT2 family glycosyltransferase
MKAIGIVICNYNKKDCVIACIRSVLESNMTDFDIYVVDNASTDDSVQAIKEIYGTQVKLIVNKENLGGSGGFNTGLRAALKKNYPYVMCLDNDVLLDENAIYSLYQFLEKHKEVGMVGSRVYNMEMPDTVQQFGLNIDFENYCLETLYENHIEDGSIPEILYCDTIATCSMMARSSVLRQIGLMPERNFIYWDDIEWGYLCNKAGYKVAAYGASKALHAMGAKKVSVSTFPTYYMWRNWIRFFMKYTSADRLEAMSLVFLKEIFFSIFECAYRGENNLKETILHAYHDALNEELGKASEGKIFPTDKFDNKLAVLLKDKHHIYVDLNNHMHYQASVQELLLDTAPSVAITFVENENTDIKICICDSIFHLKEWDKNTIYIDTHDNVLGTEDDYNFAKNYEFTLEFFLYCEQTTFLHKCKEYKNSEELVSLSN